MCFNKESSISTFISGSILSLLLYLEGDKYDKMIAIFCFVFGIMQLSEFFMWLDQDCGNINHYGSILGDIALNFQPLSILLLGYYYNAFYIPDFILIGLIFLCLIPLILKICKYLVSNKKLCSKEKESGHLKWDFAYGIENYNNNLYFSGLYFLVIIGSWGFLKDSIKGATFLILGSLSLIYSKLSFKEWESMWCFISNLAPLIFLILSKILN